MAELPPFRPLRSPSKPKKVAAKYVPGVTDFPKPAKKPSVSVSPTETILGKSPLPLVAGKPKAVAPKISKPKPVARPVPVVKTKPAVAAPKVKPLPQSHSAQVSAAKPVVSAVSPSPVGSAPKPPKQKTLKPTSDKPRKPAAANPIAPAPSIADQVSQLLNPQYGVLDTQEAQREAALKQFSQALITQLQGYPSQVAGDYGAAQSAINGYAQQAANGLAAANPNGSAQDLLKAIGAPQAQQDQIAQQNANVFGGGGAVLYDTHGAIPASQAAADQAAAVGYARSLPQIQALAALQGLRGFQNQNALAKQQIAATAPDLSLKLQAAQQDAFYKQAALDQNASALGLKTQQQGFDNKVTLAKLQQQNAQANASLRLRVAQTFGFDPNTGTKTVAQKRLEAQAIKNEKTTAKLTPDQRTKLLSEADQAAQDFYHGVAPSQHYDSSSGEFISVPGTGKPPVRYPQALRVLINKGVPFQNAVQILDTYYHPGEGGRPWVAAPGRDALKKAGIPMKTWYAKPNAKQLNFLRAHGLVSY